MLKVKRAYEPCAADDGFRVLADRLWPRGLSKQTARVDLWAKDIAPSNELRKWFGHDPKRWNEFRRRYRAELKGSKSLKDLRAELRRHSVVTLLYASKDEEHNNVTVLQAVLRK